MLVEKDKLINLLEYPDERVRRFSLDALERFFPESEELIPKILDLFQKYNEDRVYLASKIKSFTPNDEDIRNIIQLINSTNPKKDQDSFNIAYHLRQSLLYFPFKTLENNYSALSFNKGLIDLYEIAANRESLRKKGASELWNELESIAQSMEEKENLTIEDNEYVSLILEALQPYKNEIKHKVIMHLSNPKKNQFCLEDYCVQLAGQLNIEETIPYLFRIYCDTDDLLEIVNSSCCEALANIGTIEVVNEIKRLFNSKKITYEDKIDLATILSNIPYDYSEKLTLKLIKRTKDKDVKTFLAEALCAIFSLKGIDIVSKIIINKEYNPSILMLSDDLIPVFAYHNQSIKNTQEITEIAQGITKIDKEHFNEVMKADPLYSVGQKLREYMNLNMPSKQETNQPNQPKENPKKEVNNIISLESKKFKSNTKRKTSRRNKRKGL